MQSDSPGGSTGDEVMYTTALLNICRSDWMNFYRNSHNWDYGITHTSPVRRGLL